MSLPQPDSEAPLDSRKVTPNTPAQVIDRPLYSEQLLGTRGEVKIQHNGELYSLRKTRLGKLILTK